ncbi:MAG: alpha/beta hydrolase [Bacteroidetes bacterium HGW-Bacteroidetes-9]|jgi:pimeloyl-ACP methyl ester carboxylesterase|nr:MAG: alpha/beta hydrolase [Bacteroidetes bacterium HGW-Bacteroidetes-9]
MKLFYRHFGEGQPLIILHGIFGISDNWVTLGKRLAEKFSVYIPDLRNHGQSPHSPTFNYIAMADDLLEFIEEHQLKKPMIIGHSMGGKVAMTFTLEHPEMVEKLVVVDISPRKYPGRNVHFDMISAMMSVNFEAVSSRQEVESLLEQSIPNKRIRLFVMKNLYRKTRTTFDWRLNLAAISSNMDYVFDGVESAETYNGPVLFIKGGKSDYIQDDDLPLIHRNFPGAQVKTIENASHWVHADTPNELCHLFSMFLGKECSIEEMNPEE